MSRYSRAPRPAPTPAKPARPRDSQRARVYRAERAAFMADAARPLPAFGWLTSMEAARAFVSAVAAHPQVIARFPLAGKPGLSLLSDLLVTDGRGRRSACAYVDRHAIALPQLFRMRWVVLHECAHIIARARFGYQANYVAHGREFAAVYLDLVQIVFGADAHARLATAFAAHGVSFQPLLARAA